MNNLEILAIFCVIYSFILGLAIGYVIFSGKCKKKQ